MSPLELICSPLPVLILYNTYDLSGTIRYMEHTAHAMFSTCACLIDLERNSTIVSCTPKGPPARQVQVAGTPFPGQEGGGGKGLCSATYLHLHVRAHHIQLLASFRLEKVQKVGHRGQQYAATHPDRLCQLPLLHLFDKLRSFLL